MKPRKFKLSGMVALIALWTFAGALSGCSDSEPMKSVDLRFRVEEEDLAVRAYANPEPIVIQVKSTDPWKVFGENAEAGWYTISPASGEAGETYDVTITFQENTGLDDREDTITIQSDYWIGKQFLIKQKGTAFLTAEDVSVSKDGGTGRIAVQSNQKWSAAVTEGEEWLSIASGKSGERSGEILLEITPNTGEQRVGDITIYDRYERPEWIAHCTEAGVVLTPATPDPLEWAPEYSYPWFMVLDKAQTLNVDVESNTRWTAEKENPKDDWFDITSGAVAEGDGAVAISVTENTTSSVRVGVVRLSTVAEAGATPVVKTIEFRQANSQTPVVMGENIITADNMELARDQQPGRYDFDIAAGSIRRRTDVGATANGVSFDWAGAQEGQTTPGRASWWFNAFDTGDATQVLSWVATFAYSNRVNRWTGSARQAIKIADPHTISLAFYEYKAEDGISYLYVEWYLDGKFLASDITNDGTGWMMYYDNIVASGGARLYTRLGGFTITKWQYTPAIDWGEYVPPKVQ